jgi:hypothetical protein
MNVWLQQKIQKPYIWSYWNFLEYIYAFPFEIVVIMGSCANDSYKCHEFKLKFNEFNLNFKLLIKEFSTRIIVAS